MTDKWKSSPEESAFSSANKEDRSWRLVESLAFSALREQRRTRRWGIFFKVMTLSWLFLALTLVYKSAKPGAQVASTSKSHTAVVEMKGVISDDSDASASIVISGLRSAFKDKGTKAVVLKINSPGGSPVQAGYIYDEIKRLREEYPAIPLYAVITDIGASGGYYVAAAADQVFADKASLVGSIGVISSGFGFVDAMKKLGVTRRTYTSGEFKAFNDPFEPQNPEATELWQASLDTIHQQFINSVKEGRGDRLKASKEKELFSGMVWTGEQAVSLGLVDHLGSVDSVARDVVGEENTIDFSSRLTPLERFARDFGASAASTAIQLLGADSLSLR